MFRPDDDGDLARRHGAGRRRCLDDGARRQPHRTGSVAGAQPLGVKKIGLADEIRDEPLGGMIINVARRPDLENPAAAHHGDPIRHGQRLLLIVRHEHEGDAGLVLQPLELDLHLLAQLEIERRQRLVEQQHLRPRRQSPRQRHSLLLAARDLAGAPVLELAHLDELKHALDSLVDLGPGPAEHLEPEGDVAGDREMREQRVVLEHRVDRPAVGRQRRDVSPLEQDSPSARVLEAGNQPEQSGFAAAGGTEQGEEFVFPDRNADLVKRPDLILA